MKYFNEHRRRLVKEHSVIGTRATLSCEGSELSLTNTSGAGFEKIEIGGKTEQKQYNGYNLFNVDLAKLESSWVLGDKYYKKFTGFTFKKGVHYTITMSSNKGNREGFSELGLKVGFALCVNSTIEYGGTVICNRTLDTNKTTFSIYNETEDMYFALYNEGNTFGIMFTDIITDMQIVEGTEAKPYEPYVGGIPSPSPSYPQLIENTIADICCNDCVAVTNIKLCEIDGYKDNLTVNWINKNIVKHSAIELYTFTGYESISEETSGESKAYIVDLPSKKAPETKYYCTHFSVYDGNHTAFEDIVEIIDGKAWFYNPTVDLVALLKTGEVQIAYVKNYPDSENVTDTARELFNLTTPYKKNALLEVDGASSIKATYYSYENEDKLSLAVHYTDKDGKSLKDSNTYNIRENSRYTVIAPAIDGYEPLTTQYEEYLTENTEITIIYEEK